MPTIHTGTAYSLEDLPRSLAERTAIDRETGCWRVGGYHDADGYARYAGQPAHRAAWQLLVGEIPAGRPVIDHVRKRGCIWRDCIWIPHLEPVTVLQNTLRGTSFAAVNAAKDDCDRGHPFDLLNTYWRPDGHRDCRKCTARRQREYKRRLRQAAAPALARAA